MTSHFVFFSLSRCFSPDHAESQNRFHIDFWELIWDLSLRTAATLSTLAIDAAQLPHSYVLKAKKI